MKRFYFIAIVLCAVAAYGQQPGTAEVATGHAMNQPVATVDYPLKKRLIATRLHSFVHCP